MYAMATMRATSATKTVTEKVPRESTAQARKNAPRCGGDVSV